MAERLKLDTKPTLFEPIEVEIDGVVLKVKEMTLATLTQIQDLQFNTGAGSAKAIGESLATLLEGDSSIIGNLPLAKLRTLIEFVVKESVQPGGESKNGRRPGGESLPS